jgi:hypothetical protein
VTRWFQVPVGLPGDPEGDLHAAPKGYVDRHGILQCTSGSRPGFPTDGQHIYETDTYKTLIWYEAKSGWFPPWNTAWGILAKDIRTTTSTTWSATTNTEHVLSGVTLRGDRHYEFVYSGRFLHSGTGNWITAVTVDGTAVGMIDLYSVNSLGNATTGSVLYSRGTTASSTLRVQAVESSGSASFALVGDATYPRQFWVKDIGPQV